MSLSYDFELATPAPADAVARDVLSTVEEADLIASGHTADELTGPGIELLSGTTVQVGHANPTPIDPVVTDLGLSPTVFVEFRLEKSEVERQDDEMVRVVDALLHKVSGDAVLTFGGDVILLVRRNGALTVTDDDEFWPPARLALLGHHHTRGPLKFADE